MYQQSPQYRDVNHWMALADFKRIFFWEYVHRVMGRLTGALVLLPWLYFVWRKRLSRALTLQTLGVFALGGLQGLLGWYMVQSGLVDEPGVSPYRLTAHLLLAFATGQLVLWLALDGRSPRRPSYRVRGAHLAMVWALLALLALQVAYGGLMAGTHAGYYASTFPDMNGGYSPRPFFTGASWWQDAFGSPLAIHYLHRCLAWLVLCYAIGLSVYLRSREARTAVRRAAVWVAATAFVQLNLGAFTVVSRVAIPWAIAHQGMAYLLVSSALVLLHRALGSEPSSAH
jgi:cytochrome c oxidase assembly protein subunit 15